MRVKEVFNKKLLVEGNDDHHVILALCLKFQIAETFDIIDCEGIEKLFDQIPVRLKQSGLNTIGLIIDADSDLSNRWNKLRTIFEGQGIYLPESLPKEGFIFPNDIRIGIWIMPNNLVNGMLEDFIEFLIPKQDALLPIIHANLGQIEGLHLNRYIPIHKTKALIHSWLSVQEEPGTPLGLSITKKYLTTDENTCTNLVGWLTTLFKEN